MSDDDLSATTDTETLASPAMTATARNVNVVEVIDGAPL